MYNATGTPDSRESLRKVLRHSYGLQSIALFLCLIRNPGTRIREDMSGFGNVAKECLGGAIRIRNHNLAFRIDRIDAGQGRRILSDGLCSTDRTLVKGYCDFCCRVYFLDTNPRALNSILNRFEIISASNDRHADYENQNSAKCFFSW